MMNTCGRLGLVVALAALTLTASAETYRWLDPATGRVVLSNQPPPAGIKPQRRTPSDGSDSELPPALREPVQRFPVVLYTTPQCKEVCTDARNLLQTRGIPFAEKSAATPEAQAELKGLAGDTLIPTLMVGRQAARGFDIGNWSSLLDLAGYPQRPVAGYRPPAPKPAAKPDPNATPETAATAPAR